YVHFVDDSTEARGVIRRNADTLGEIGRCKIWRRDVARLGPCAPLPPFDLVFIDPPYGKGLGERALGVIVDGGWLNGEAIVVLEESAREEIEVPAGFEAVSVRTYGDTQVIILKAGPTCP
ncbi:MAG: 16S rRNA (guanine(966)-N(2))-methyltransferase RsmD, partial [Rhizobiales bacterium]|nr:16S rRNA (guanine(966)-N(2))-methyltransferase RsmD [Hyphomicrobiales bacterium]